VRLLPKQRASRRTDAFGRLIDSRRRHAEPKRQPLRHSLQRLAPKPPAKKKLSGFDVLETLFEVFVMWP
jgi:hypothetical protein